MSKKAVIKLIESADKDINLRKQLFDAQDPETILAIAKEKGYQFTQEELLIVMQEKQISFASDDELSEEQLESVVGGKDSMSSGNFITNQGVSKKVYRTPGGDLVSKTNADVYYKA